MRRYSVSEPRFHRRLLQTALVCLLAVVMLGANASSDPSTRFGRIGHNLMCVCSCGQVLLDCNHVGCPDSERMIGELRGQIGGGGTGASGGGSASGSGGGSDSAILNWFVAKYGATVLAAPIRGGFDNLAWILPLVIFIFAILGTALLVRMWAQRRRMIPVTGAVFPEPANDAVRDRIRRETEWR